MAYRAMDKTPLTNYLTTSFEMSVSYHPVKDIAKRLNMTSGAVKNALIQLSQTGMGDLKVEKFNQRLWRVYK